MLVLLFFALWFILRGDFYYVLPCVILFLCFTVLLALRLPVLGKRELVLVLFACLFDLHLFGFFLFPLPLGVWDGLWFVIVALPGLFSYLFFFFHYGQVILQFDGIVHVKCTNAEVQTSRISKTYEYMHSFKN